jgi:hypothetical protein
MTNPTKLAEILEQVFTYGVGTQSEDIKDNEKAYLNLQKHAITTGEAAILAWIDEAIGPNNYDDLTPPAIAKNVYRDQLRHNLGIDTKKEA